MMHAAVRQDLSCQIVIANSPSYYSKRHQTRTIVIYYQETKAGGSPIQRRQDFEAWLEQVEFPEILAVVELSNIEIPKYFVAY